MNILVVSQIALLLSEMKMAGHRAATTVITAAIRIATTMIARLYLKGPIFFIVHTILHLIFKLSFAMSYLITSS